MPKLPPQDERAITALLQTLAEGWARRDGELFASAFTEDADFINMQALALRGRAEIAAHHNRIFNGVYQGTRLRVDETHVRLIRPDVATIEVAAAVEGLPQERRAHALAIAVRDATGWHLCTFHNMIPFAPPKTD